MNRDDEPRIGTDKHGLACEEMTSLILEAFYDVYNELGHGFMESVYRNAMTIALRAKGLSCQSEVGIKVYFRGDVVGDFRADLVVEERVIVELKSARALDPAHEVQILNYLRATAAEVGLLLNFGPKPVFKRFLFTNDRKNGRKPNPC